jgi:hypothetical protein
LRVTSLLGLRNSPSPIAAKRSRWALLGWILSRDWLFDLLGEKLTVRLLRAGLSAPADSPTFTLALGQIDRLPEWYDLLSRFVADPERERAALGALASAPRLVGPYTSTIVRDALQSRVRDALGAEAPAEALWQVSLDALRWARLAPGLAAVPLALPDRRTTILDCSARLRDLVREIASDGSISPSLNAALLAWPTALENGGEESPAAGRHTYRRAPSVGRQADRRAA